MGHLLLLCSHAVTAMTPSHSQPWAHVITDLFDIVIVVV